MESRSAPTPWTARWHLRAELARVLDRLAQLLEVQRSRGRTPSADVVSGLLIEHGEAEGLIAELATHLAGGEQTPRTRPPEVVPDPRRQIRERADSGAAAGEFLPLRHAAKAFELTDSEYDAVLLALAVEHDPRFGRLIAYLNDHVSRTRPTIGLAGALAALDGSSELVPITLTDRPVLRDGLLEFEGDGPLPGLSLVMPRDLLPRFYGEGPPAADTVSWLPADGGNLSRLVLPDDTRQQLEAWADAQRRGTRVPPVILAGREGSGRRTLAHAAASRAGLPLVSVALGGDDGVVSLRLLRREARWHGASALVRVGDVPAATVWSTVWRELSGIRAPVFISISETLTSVVMAAAPTPPMLVVIPRADVDTRFRWWRALLPSASGLTDQEIAELAAKFRLGPRAIAQAVARVVASASLARPDSAGLTRDILEDSARRTAESGVGRLAQKLPLSYTRKELIVPAEVETELNLAVAWVRHEQQVLDRWGFNRRVPLGRGLTALFAGPPGTGKTMAAQVLAHELGLDLYRVDLSRVMSKYIGDTEKALAHLFDHAESCILFFDEADALFGKRSEVKDAHDRYANIEIGYLLQRMEEHDGVTVLATNRMRDMDEAFVRRFHVIVNFPLPSEPDRWRIWDGMFPEPAREGAELDLTNLARDFELSGGEIKNAALAAAYLAAAEHGPIAMRHLKTAIRREIVKAGRVVPEHSGS